MSDKTTEVRSYCSGPPTRTVYYKDLSDAELLEHCRHNGGPGNFDKYDRNMLLALLHNRNRCGYFIEILDDPDADERLRSAT